MGDWKRRAAPPLPILAELREWGDLRMDLKGVQAALEALGRPQRCFRGLVVGGTNGKGTVALNLALSLPGQTGLFLSPHLWDVRERISLDGVPVSDLCWQEAWREWEACRKGIELSYFETTFVMAVLIFRRLKLEWAVFEVGLGGRLDAVNALDPELSVLTQVGLDHMAILGESHEQIALEKIEIARKDRKLVLPKSVARMPEVAARLREIGCLLKEVPCENCFGDNVKILDATLEELGLPPAGRLLGRLAGRQEVLRKSPALIVDGAHNPPGWNALVAWIREKHGDKKWNLVVGLSNGRTPEACLSGLSELKGEKHVWLPGFEREVPLNLWPEDVKRIDESDLETLLQGDTLVCGSLYLVGLFRRWWQERTGEVLCRVRLIHD